MYVRDEEQIFSFHIIDTDDNTVLYLKIKGCIREGDQAQVEPKISSSSV